MKVSSANDALFFFSTSRESKAVLARCCSWTNVDGVDPFGSLTQETADGSYGERGMHVMGCNEM